MPDSQRYSALEGLEPVKARIGGHGLPVPPLVPIVAVLALLAGISIGYGLAPKIQPVAATAVPDPTDTPTHPPVSLPSGYSVDWPAEPGDPSQVHVYILDGEGAMLVASGTMPPQGVSLAVAAANQLEPVDLASVVAARVEPYYMVNPYASPNIWVWAIEVRVPNPDPCGPFRFETVPPAGSTIGPATDADVICSYAYETVIVDYKTGIWLETIASPAP